MTIKPTNADDGGAATDRAAALAANVDRLKAALWRRWGPDYPSAGYDKMLFNEVLFVIKDLETEASRPAQDIVAEMREKVEARLKEYKTVEAHLDPGDENYSSAQEKLYVGCMELEWFLAILSPTKNTAPTEAEES